MHFQTKSVLAAATGILILILLVTLQHHGRFPFVRSGQGQSEEVKVRDLQLHRNANSVAGLYGYFYRGF